MRSHSLRKALGFIFLFLSVVILLVSSSIGSYAQVSSPAAESSAAESSVIESEATEAQPPESARKVGASDASSSFLGLSSYDLPITSRFQSRSQLPAQWIWLDGVRLFQIADSPGQVADRRQRIQTTLRQIYREYLNHSDENPDPSPEIEIRIANQLPVLYINDQYLMTVTQADGQLHDLPAQAWATQLQLSLTQSFETLQRQRQSSYLLTEAKQLAFLAVGVAVLSSLLAHWRRQVHRRPVKLLSFETDVWIKRLSRQQQTRLRGLQLVVLQLGQVTFWIATVIFSLSRFPQTRPFAIHLLGLFRIPLVLSLAALASYLLIRLSSVLIDRLSLALSRNPLVTETQTNRTQQRISTLARVLKGVSLVTIILITILAALIILGVNIGPLLAGAGILGVAISLASQGLIKDAINGALILIEDQYGVDDVVEICEWVGLVETLNLRMTQLRNSEGKLITIPNSEVRIVANLSNQWSRVDLDIPVPYNADLVTMMALIEATAVKMMRDDQWKDLILEHPELMGVDGFGDRGLIIKLWIKTQPLKQWDVAREYRRRLKLELDQINVDIPVPQQSLWLHNLSQESQAEPHNQV